MLVTPTESSFPFKISYPVFLAVVSLDAVNLLGHIHLIMVSLIRQVWNFFSFRRFEAVLWYYVHCLLRLLPSLALRSWKDLELLKNSSPSYHPPLIHLRFFTISFQARTNPGLSRSSHGNMLQYSWIISLSLVAYFFKGCPSY